jgi:hypothetical protein
VYSVSTALRATPVIASPEIALDTMKAPATAIAVRPAVPILIYAVSSSLNIGILCIVAPSPTAKMCIPIDPTRHPLSSDPQV